MLKCPKKLCPFPPLTPIPEEGCGFLGICFPVRLQVLRVCSTIPGAKPKQGSQPRKERALPDKLISLPSGSEGMKWKWMVSSEPARVLLF